MMCTLKHFIESSNTRVSEDVVIGIRSHLYSLKFLFWELLLDAEVAGALVTAEEEQLVDVSSDNYVEIKFLGVSSVLMD
jgi:hypothetical protein